MKHLVLAIVIGGSLAACMPMPGDSMGGSRSAPVPMVPFTGAPSNTHPMMENPDAQAEETTEEIWAVDETDASRQCESIARNRTKDSGTLVTVQGRPQQRSTNPSSNGTFKFVCRFRSEI